MNASATAVDVSAALTPSWPRGTVRRVNDEWHVRVDDYDPIHGLLRTDHVESSWDRAWAWLDSLRRVIA